MMHKKPNFFIIGAPKCGTTSLAAWLAEHPNIYMSPVKEPHFYSTDLNYFKTRTERDYARLFLGTNERHIAVGEASVFYLFSQVAIPRIEKECPGARYIVMVRNPVEMAHSLHEQQLFAGYEHIPDFEAAWQLSPERREGRAVSRWCREPKLLDYQSVCQVGQQLKRLFTIVPRTRVLVLVLDDMREDPRREYLKVLEFLGVPDNGRVEFPVKNPAKQRRSSWMRKMELTIGNVSRTMKETFGIPLTRGTGVLQAMNRFNREYRPRSPLSPALRAELTEYFRTEILLLERFLHRDLSSWLDPSG